MSATKEEVVETHLRYAGSAQLFINKDASWSIGPNTKALVPVHFGQYAAINDDTFGFSAVAVEKTDAGYTLWVRAEADKNTIVEVKVSATGEVDASSITQLSRQQVEATEERIKFDLNGSGGYGSGFVVLEGGAVSLMKSADGAYAVGPDVNHAVVMTLGGAKLTDGLLPPGWKITKALADGANYDVFAKDPSGLVFNAKFNAAGEYTGGAVVETAQVATTEAARGVDLNGDHSLAAAAGWTAALKNATIKSSVDTALADGQISYGEAVSLMDAVIQAHKSGGSPITADEVADLQAVSARGKAVFTGGSATANDYLAFVFSKMVDGSVANRFYTGGELTASELGNLTAASSVSQLEKLVDKWLRGGDLPAPVTGGDKANPQAAEAKPSYAKSTGTLFVDGVTLGDVNQGSAGDCYLIADMLGAAAISPSSITSMIVDNGTINGTHTWGVRFFDGTGAANWVTVNDMLPVSATGQLQYARNAASDLNGEIWVPLVEKAYAQTNMLEILQRAETTGQNSYLAIEGGQGDPIAQIMGGKVTAYSLDASDNSKNPYVSKTVVVDRNDPASLNGLISTLSSAMNAGKAIWVGTTEAVKDSFGNILLAGGHAQLGLDADKANPNSTAMLVYNPWGLADTPNPPAASPQGHVSPATFEIAQLVGMTGIDFWILDTTAGG
jgi:hypothetical protein